MSIFWDAEYSYLNDIFNNKLKYLMKEPLILTIKIICNCLKIPAGSDKHCNLLLICVAMEPLPWHKEISSLMFILVALLDKTS